jgi:PAS domain S-box-containing protein
MWIFDEETLGFLDVNEAAVDEYGYSRDEFHSMTLLDIRPSSNDKAALLFDIGKHNARHHKDGPWRHRKKDGSIIDVDITSISMNYRGRPAKFVMAMDITERKRADREIRAHLEQLARSNRDLKQFAYAASHDLQEPIRKVTIFAQLLKSQEGLLSEREAYADIILEGALRIHDLVEGLRRYWELAETEPVRVEPVDLNDVVDEVIERLKPAIDGAGGIIRHSPLPTLSANRSEIELLFEELLENALKFRANRPLEIAISAQRHEREWEICVQDNGLGMNPAYTDQIFGIFKRLSRSYPGTGIGLALARKVVERYGGRIHAQSAEDAGAAFVVTWPADAKSAEGSESQ